MPQILGSAADRRLKAAVRPMIHGHVYMDHAPLDDSDGFRAPFFDRPLPRGNREAAAAISEHNLSSNDTWAIYRRGWYDTQHLIDMMRAHAWRLKHPSTQERASVVSDADRIECPDRSTCDEDPVLRRHRFARAWSRRNQWSYRKIEAAVLEWALSAGETDHGVLRWGAWRRSWGEVDYLAPIVPRTVRGDVSGANVPDHGAEGVLDHPVNVETLSRVACEEAHALHGAWDLIRRPPRVARTLDIIDRRLGENAKRKWAPRDHPWDPIWWGRDNRLSALAAHRGAEKAPAPLKPAFHPEIFDYEIEGTAAFGLTFAPRDKHAQEKRLEVIDRGFLIHVTAERGGPRLSYRVRRAEAD